MSLLFTALAWSFAPQNSQALNPQGRGFNALDVFL
jgi:hypothetical protein